MALPGVEKLRMWYSACSMDIALPSAKPRLILADGTGIVRRVYEAVKGEDTPERAEGALRSSWGSFLRALREHEPTHFLAAFDHGGETWRHRLFADYKLDRKPMAEALSAALPGFLERMNNAGMRTLRVPDVEADDTIATLALRAAARGFDVIVLASDKDLLRLLDHGIRIYDHFQSEWRDHLWVKERYGVTPAQMTDYLALMGDDIDGIPGVVGVGEKTAPKLLADYGDLDGVLANAAHVKGKVGERLREGAEIARLSRALATLKSDVELGITPRDIRLPAQLIEHAQSMPAPRVVQTAHSAESVAKRLDDAQWVVGEAREIPAAEQRAQASRRLRM